MAAVIAKVVKTTGLGKKLFKDKGPAEAQIEKVAEKPEQGPVMATQEEKAAAAKRRARAGGRRQLLSGGRLGTSDEGQTTLGA